MPKDERSPTTDALTHDGWLDLLKRGEIEVEGRMPWSSNATLLVSIATADASGRAIYKPYAGEYPLWDFPVAIYRREVAAYELSEAFGWEIVPETIERVDAPYGEGSLQRFIEADFEQHYFTLIEDPSHHDRLRLIAGFDLLANSADRKGGHLLIDKTGHIYGIDNGLSFHCHSKLRTVMWDFAGEMIPEAVLEVAGQLIDTTPPGVAALLSDSECAALQRRAKDLVDEPIFPAPDLEGRPFPWPRI